jgi:CubicO group peptidase (beta-lactamase class C family)
MNAARDQVWERAWTELTQMRSDDGEHLLFPGLVLLGVQDGKQLFFRAGGWAYCYADDSGSMVPEADRVPMRPDTIFDLASVSKLFTTLVIMRLVQDGRIDLDRAVVDYLPEFGIETSTEGEERDSDRKRSIPVRQLLTHTSGFPAMISLWGRFPDRATRIRGTLTAGLIADPGTSYCYSDLNLITLGELAHRLTDRPLDRLVAEWVTGPLGMVDTGYCPQQDKQRIAAAEYETDPNRGVVWGEVHDENAWSLGGVAGHAGVFSDAAGLSRLAEAVIANDRDGTGPLLDADHFRAMITNQNPDFAGHDHGLGFEINQDWYMGRLAGPRTIGHTGFTGTSVVIDLDRSAYVILLTNRVHPSRNWSKINSARVVAADALAETIR